MTPFRAFLNENPTLIIEREFNWQSPTANPGEVAKDEAFWGQVRADFPEVSGPINLNNGGVASNPFIVEEAYTRLYRLLNQSPSYYNWKVMEQGREAVREGLAGLLNADAGEMCLLRNCTEALNNVIFGIDLKPGDEVVACRQDYSKAVHSWNQREQREGIRMVWVDLAGPEETDEQIVAKYVSAISDKTKLLHLTHVINWNGQVLPIRAIIAEAKKRSIPVLLDGAHSFGLLETDMRALGCEYFVTALHKWLSGPIPTALLYVRKDKIENLWPLASAAEPKSTDIRKFEELSIQSAPALIGLGYAVEYHNRLGRTYKEARARYLRRQWTESLLNIPGLRFSTPLAEDRCCIIANLAIAGLSPDELENALLERGIHTVAIYVPPMQGVRITANIYTKPEELEKMVAAVTSII